MAACTTRASTRLHGMKRSLVSVLHNIIYKMNITHCVINELMSLAEIAKTFLCT